MTLRLGVPLLLGAVLLGGCGTGGLGQEGQSASGKQLFQQKCGSCHVLADAGSLGKVGPNLDDAFAAMRPSGKNDQNHFSDSTIRSVVLDQIRFAISPMPSNIVKGSDAEDVASYVASVAGRAPPAGGSGVAAGAPPGGAGAAAAGAGSGKQVFTSNCSSCHTLAAAGATGAVGPNLDQLKPAAAIVKNQVIHGGGAMPAFKGRLTDAQIAAVATFVASSAGK